MTKFFESRCIPERLFAPVDEDTDNPGIISAYTKFEAQRFNIHQGRDITASLKDQLDILHWYLVSYSNHRKAPVPLSGSQISFLNAPHLLGINFPLSNVALSFAVNELGRPFSAFSKSEFLEICYWWCIERSPQISFNDCLVTPSMFEALVKPLDGHGSLEFGLNNFLDRYRSTSEELRDLHPAVRDDRVVLLTHALAASAINPKLARYLPRESCRRLLAIDRGTDQSMFERLLDFGLHGASFGSQFSGRQLQDYLEDRLARAGHEIGGHSSARPLSRAGLECFVPAGMSLDHVERGISLIGPFDAASGLGQATRMSAEVISESSLPLSIIDFSWDNPAPTGFSESRRFNPPRHPTSINLIHLNAESLPMALSHLEPRIYEHSYNIGYFFWELSELPACHFLSLNVLDEIWVASEYNREVYERAVDIPVKNVGMAVQPLTNVRHRSRAHFGLPSDTLLFLITFDSFSFIERKNPLAAIAAFHLAFPPERGEKVGLVIKTQNRYRVMDPHQVRIWSKIDHVIGLDPRIVLINETLHYEDLIALKLCCDCYVSLHRSEGLGFGMIESMQLKMPVIATSYGGNMDFMDASTAFLVDYKLIPVQRGEYIFVEPGSMWAQPDVVQASQQMLHVYADPAFARDRGEAASQAIQQNFSVDAIRGRYIRRLDEIERIIETKVS